MSLLLRFYLVAMVLTGSQLLLALAGRRRETVHRALTLLALLNLICLTVWLGPVAFGLLSAAIVLMGWLELGGRLPLLAATAVWFAVLLRWPQILALAAPLGLAAVLVALVGGPGVTARRDFAAAFALALVVPGAAALTRLAAPNPAPLLGLILLVQLNDAFAYLAGRRFGRTRLFPATSPNKSAEGYAAGALALALGIGLLHTRVLPLLAGVPPVDDVGIFVFVLLLANLGDLGLSALKRGRGVKDFGGLLPGHGGVLDRFGNLLLAAPLAALLWSQL